MMMKMMMMIMMMMHRYGRCVIPTDNKFNRKHAISK